MRHGHRLRLSQQKKDEMGAEFESCKSQLPQALRHLIETLESKRQLMLFAWCAAE